MNHQGPFVKRFLLALLLSLAVSGAFYFAFFSWYITPVLAVAEFLVNLFFPSIRLTPLASPTSLEISLEVVIGAMAQISLQVNLFAVSINVILAPSLVLATLGFTLKGLGRALAATVMMIGIHALTVMIFVLHFLHDQHGVFLTASFPDLVVALIQVIWRFLITSFGFLLPPFLIWILLCFAPLSQQFSGSDHPAADKLSPPPKKSLKRR